MLSPNNTDVKVQQNVNEFNSRTWGGTLQLAVVQLGAYKFICIYKVQTLAETDTNTRMRKICNNPELGASRPATSMVINLSEVKRWQIKAFKWSYFLHTTRQEELMSQYAAPQITPREKNSSLQTAECGGSTPSGEVILRLIGLCGIHWTWLHPPPRGLGVFLIGALQAPSGNIPPQLSLSFFTCFVLEVLLPAPLPMAFRL